MFCFHNHVFSALFLSGNVLSIVLVNNNCIMPASRCFVVLTDSIIHVDLLLLSAQIQTESISSGSARLSEEAARCMGRHILQGQSTDDQRDSCWPLLGASLQLQFCWWGGRGGVLLFHELLTDFKGVTTVRYMPCSIKSCWFVIIVCTDSNWVYQLWVCPT